MPGSAFSEILPTALPGLPALLITPSDTGTGTGTLHHLTYRF